ASLAQDLDERTLIHAVGPREVHQHRVGLHRRELGRADHSLGLRRSWHCQNDPVELAEMTAPPPLPPARYGEHIYAERLERPPDRLPDRTISEHQRPAAGEVASARSDGEPL